MPQVSSSGNLVSQKNGIDLDRVPDAERQNILEATIVLDQQETGQGDPKRRQAKSEIESDLRKYMEALGVKERLENSLTEAKKLDFEAPSIMASSTNDEFIKNCPKGVNLRALGVVLDSFVGNQLPEEPVSVAFTQIETYQDIINTVDFKDREWEATLKATLTQAIVQKAGDTGIQRLKQINQDKSELNRFNFGIAFMSFSLGGARKNQLKEARELAIIQNKAKQIFDFINTDAPGSFKQLESSYNYGDRGESSESLYYNPSARDLNEYITNLLQSMREISQTSRAEIQTEQVEKFERLAKEAAEWASTVINQNSIPNLSGTARSVYSTQFTALSEFVNTLKTPDERLNNTLSAVGITKEKGELLTMLEETANSISGSEPQPGLKAVDDLIIADGGRSLQSVVDAVNSAIEAKNLSAKDKLEQIGDALAQVQKYFDQIVPATNALKGALDHIATSVSEVVGIVDPYTKADSSETQALVNYLVTQVKIARYKELQPIAERARANLLEKIKANIVTLQTTAS